MADQPDERLHNSPLAKNLAAHSILIALEEAEIEGRFVGGCVRDALLGQAILDIDIAVKSHPENLMDVLKSKDISVYPIGIEHGVILARVDNYEPIQLSALRKDISTDGRRAIVSFGSSWREDAQRRDFTINAIYADRLLRIYDPLTEGMNDLRAGIVRFIGNADERIKEDHLRILRYFRFLASFASHEAEADALAACIGNAHLLAKISGERVGAEMQKLLLALDPQYALELICNTDIGTEIALAKKSGSKEYALLSSLLRAEEHFELRPSWFRRLAIMLTDKGELQELAKRWRLARKDKNRLATLIEAGNSSYQPAALAHLFGAEIALDASLISYTRGNIGLTDQQTLRQEISQGAKAVFPLKAKDLLEHGVAAGPEMGRIIKQARKEWISSGMSLTRKQLLGNYVKK